MQNFTEKTVGIIGLGNMGQGMAATFIREGFEVVGTDLNQNQQIAAKKLGVKVVANIKELCEKSNNIVLSLPMAKHVEAVVTGAGGIIEHAQASSLIMDTTTSEPKVSVSLANKLKNIGHTFLDCPVSGGPAGASSGSMVILVGGDSNELHRAMPFLEVLSSKVEYLGASGNGHIAKLINNLLCAAHLVTTAEALKLGIKAGLDPKSLIQGINAGSGRSAISEVNFPRWILNEEYDSGFTMGLMRKDVDLAKQLIKDMELELNLSEQVSDIWSDSAKNIPAEQDFNRIVSDYINAKTDIGEQG